MEGQAGNPLKISLRLLRYKNVFVAARGTRTLEVSPLTETTVSRRDYELSFEMLFQKLQRRRRHDRLSLENYSCNRLTEGEHNSMPHSQF